MLRECFEHQHPEAYGRPEVAACYPFEARASVENYPWSQEFIPEERGEVSGAWALP